MDEDFDDEKEPEDSGEEEEDDSCSLFFPDIYDPMFGH
jgi:hypothetical protein